MHYRSALVFGKARFLTNSKEKQKILELLINKFDHTKLAKPLDETMTHRVEVGEIIIEEITGKKNE
jgi:nitroimidazol reductase NimA-like FMN-containing flavoprotein (pyridoxamine 5'-phosphate oxidase superfamily)